MKKNQFCLKKKTAQLLIAVIICIGNTGIAQRPATMFIPKRPTIDKLYYNDRATTGEIEAGPMEVQFFFLPDSTHLVLWTADRDVAYYDKLDFTTISSPRYILYNWHTGLPVAMCPSTIDYTDRYSKAWQRYELRMQYCKNPLEMFCKPDQLPVVDKNPKNYYHDDTKYGNNQWALTHHKSDSRYSVANAEIGDYNSNGNMWTVKKLEFPSAIPYNKPAICPGLPVCAVLNQTDVLSYEDHMLRGRIDIMNIETGEKISSLANWREYQKYDEVVKKHLADSIATVRRKEQMHNVIDGIRSEGWTIENLKYGLGVAQSSTYTDDWGVWNFTPKSNRIYSTLVLSSDKSSLSSPALIAEKHSDRTIGMSDYLFETNYLRDLADPSAHYMISQPIYNSKPNEPFALGVSFSCLGHNNDCLSKEMADSNNLCRLLISHEKPAANEIAIKAIDETLKILEVQATYIAAVKQIKQNETDWAAEEKEKKKQELAEAEMEKKAKAKDANFRKQWIASIKKILKPGQIVRQEIVKREVNGDDKIDLNTAFDESLKRIVVVMTNGENNELVILNEGDEDNSELVKPGTTLNLNGYTVSRFSFFNQAEKISLGMTENKAADYTILVMTEKNDKAYADYKKGMSDVQEANEKNKAAARDKINLEYYKENAANDERVKKIRSAFEYFANSMNSKYLDAKNNGADWSLNKQIDAFNKAKDDVNSLGKNIFNNLPDGLNTGNPSYNSYNNWFKNASNKFKDIRAKIEKLQSSIEERKTLNRLYAEKPLLDYLFYLPLQDMADIAKSFNSFLNSDNPK